MPVPHSQPAPEQTGVAQCPSEPQYPEQQLEQAASALQDGGQGLVVAWHCVP
jgi:hypothetical protein